MAGLEADFAMGRRVSDPSPRRPRTMSLALPRWPRTKSSRDSVTAGSVADFAAAVIELTELAVNLPGCASFVARSGGK